MGITHFHPLRPTWPHLRNRAVLMSTARQHFFVYVTKTYVRSKKWDAVLAKFPFDSGTCSGKLIKSIAQGSNRTRKMRGELACKPGSVEGNHSSRSCVTTTLQQPTRKHAGPTLRRDVLR